MKSRPVLAMMGSLVLGCAAKKPGSDAPAVASAQGNAGHPARALEAGIPGWDENALTNAAYAIVSHRPLEISSVSTQFRWHPADGQELLVWGVCQGAGDSRGCTVLVGKPWNEHQLRVLAYQPCGWSEPTVSETADRAQLLVSGDDGRGTWRQLLMYDADGGLYFAPRAYADGI